MSQVYMLDSDRFEPGPWRLGSPVTAAGMAVDPRIFTSGHRVETAYSLMIPIVEVGEPLDLSFATFEMPVVSGGLGRALERVAGDDIQLFPAQIGSLASEWYVLNVTSLKTCIDERRAQLCSWAPGDPSPRGNLPYRTIVMIGLTPLEDSRTHLSRVFGWNHLIVCDDRVKQEIERFQVLGLRFIPVRDR